MPSSVKAYKLQLHLWGGKDLLSQRVTEMERGAEMAVCPQN